jgi:hypothetical protein
VGGHTQVGVVYIRSPRLPRVSSVQAFQTIAQFERSGIRLPILSKLSLH